MTTPAPAGTTETSQTLSRGLDVLERLAAAPGGLSPAQLAGDLGLSRTIVYRLVATLTAHGYASRRDDGTFGIGSRVLGLTAHVHPALRAASRDILQRLADDVGATAHFSIVEGAESIAVAVVEPTRADFHVSYRLGTRAPLTRGAHCRALLAARRGRFEVVYGKGELMPGAYGAAAAVPGLDGIEGAVGVVGLLPLDPATVGPRVLAAAGELRTAF